MSKRKFALFLTAVFVCVELPILVECALHVLCPQQCRCSALQSSTDVTEVHALCSDQRIRNVSEIVSALSNVTTVLDLSDNLIRSIAPDEFSGLPNLAELSLRNNLIASIESGAFRGLKRLQSVDLRRNVIETIKSDAFLEAGAVDGCRKNRTFSYIASIDVRCGVDLRLNSISSIERNAFAWMKGLDLHLGNSSAPLNVDAYAFYGAQDMANLVLSDIPSVTLNARLFTNVEGLRKLTVSNTNMHPLKGFVFEGLKKTERFNFTDVSFSEIESFAFSGVEFALGDSTGRNITASNSGGGEVIFNRCSFRVLPIDGFRDTNLAQLGFNNCTIESIQSNAFRGMSALQEIRLSRTRIVSLSERGFGALRNLEELILDDVGLHVLLRESFSEVSDVALLRISVATNLTLHLDAFSGCANIGTLEISGSRPGLSLRINEGAFNNLVSVDRLIIRNFSVPALEKGAFQGMAKVKHMKIENCNVGEISKLAFGEAFGHQGAIEALTMEVGNNIKCNCQTLSVLRLLRHKFFTYNVRCTTEDSQNVEVGNHSLGPECTPSGSFKSTPSICLLLTILMVLGYRCFSVDFL